MIYTNYEELAKSVLLKKRIKLFSNLEEEMNQLINKDFLLIVKQVGLMLVDWVGI